MEAEEKETSAVCPRCQSTVEVHDFAQSVQYICSNETCYYWHVELKDETQKQERTLYPIQKYKV